jgi:hypothetical protein
MKVEFSIVMFFEDETSKIFQKASARQVDILAVHQDVADRDVL